MKQSKFLFGFLINFLIACTSPPIHVNTTLTCGINEPTAETCLVTPRVIRTVIDPEFTHEQRILITQAVLNLRGLNVFIVFVGQREPHELFIERWHNRVNDICLHDFMGIYNFHTTLVKIDPDCTVLDHRFQVVVIHEIMHYLGMEHICLENGQTTDSCSPVGRGIAVENPYITLDHTIILTELDHREYNRVLAQRCANIRH